MSKNQTGFSGVNDASFRSGVYIFWNSGEAVGIDGLKAAWEKQGLDPLLLPPIPEPKTALSRALDELRERRRIVRQVKPGLWSIKAENVDADGEDLNYTTECKTRLDAAGRVKVEPEDHRLAGEIKGAYAKHLDTYSFGSVISGWIIQRLRSLGATRVMADGGLYYLPEEARDNWEPICTAIVEATHCDFQETNVCRDDKLVATVLGAIVREAGKRRTDVYAEIDSQAVGEKALSNRIAECEAQRSTLEQYRALLGGHLDKIVEEYETMEAALGEAKLAARQRKEAAETKATANGRA